MTQPLVGPCGKANDGGPQVSVVIPSYNSTRSVRKCLRSLQQQRTRRQVEIIVVDSSDDGADRIVAEEFPEVRLVHLVGRRSVGIGRNIGVGVARGEIILFLDTDCVAPATWIDDMCTAIEDLGADGIGGSVSNGTPWSIGGSVGFYLEFFRVLAYRGKARKTPYLVGGNCGFRRDVFRTARYGNLSIGDDFIFNYQLMNEGRQLWYVPAITIQHLNRAGLRDVLRYQYKLGVGACAYRYQMSRRLVCILMRLPFLVVLMPLAVMIWVAGTILQRHAGPDFLKFVAVLPFALVANGVWAAGFLHELLHRRRRVCSRCTPGVRCFLGRPQWA